MGENFSATLFSGAQTVGKHMVSWDGRNVHGARVNPGVYLMHLDTANGLRVARILVVE